MTASAVLCTTVSSTLFRPCQVFVRPVVHSHGRSTCTALCTPSVHNLEYRAHYLCQTTSEMGVRLSIWCRKSCRVPSGRPRRRRGGWGRAPPRPAPRLRVHMYGRSLFFGPPPSSTFAGNAFHPPPRHRQGRLVLGFGLVLLTARAVTRRKVSTSETEHATPRDQSRRDQTSVDRCSNSVAQGRYDNRASRAAPIGNVLHFVSLPPNRAS